MTSREIIWILLFLAGVYRKGAGDVVIPKGLRLGVATSAYQIEGGWNASGKGENVWDRLTHTHPELILGGTNGDVNCDSYNKWDTDLEILIDLKVDHYRFSISWTRILPDGFSTRINPDGVRYYNRIINGLLENKIEPIVTIFHWDLPQILQDLGGWTNPIMADYFEDYAKVVFDLFGDRVKTWITINEPYSLCWDTYEVKRGAPDVFLPGVGLYLCGKSVLLAHAKAYRMYERDFKGPQGGKVGITLNTDWFEPKTNSSADIEAAERELQMHFGWFAHPLLSQDGNYPQIMKSRIYKISKTEGFFRSRLPQLTEAEIKLIRGSYDFLGLNHYNTLAISDKVMNFSEPTSYAKDKGTEASKNPDWLPSPDIVPWGLRKLLNFIKDSYGNPEVVITENGFADAGWALDPLRVVYIQEFIRALVSAITEDKCNVTGYTVWSLLDDMEWRSGYTIQYGLYNVNFNDPDRPRIGKLSSNFYREILHNRTIPDKINIPSYIKKMI